MNAHIILVAATKFDSITQPGSYGIDCTAHYKGLALSW